MALTDHVHTQDEILDGFHELWKDESFERPLLDRFFRSVQVEKRHLALPIEAYPKLNGFSDANRAFVEVGLQLGEEAVARAILSAGLEPADVDAVFFTTVTGVAAPTIDAMLMNRMGFRSDVKRYPFFGLGCVAGVAGVSRMTDYLTAFPDQVALLLSVELCSLTLQKKDLSIPAIVSAALFGDGASAVVGFGARRDRPTANGGTHGPNVLATRSVFYPDTEDVMGWDVGTDGFRVVLSADVPSIVMEHLRGDVDGFLAEHGLELSDIKSWVCHPGGPKVIEALQTSLDLQPTDLERTWTSLRSIGNLSSSSVLFVLQDTIEQSRPEPGTLGLMLAMGPGFCSELVLLEW